MKLQNLLSLAALCVVASGELLPRAQDGDQDTSKNCERANEALLACKRKFGGELETDQEKCSREAEEAHHQCPASCLAKRDKDVAACENEKTVKLKLNCNIRAVEEYKKCYKQRGEKPADFRPPPPEQGPPRKTDFEFTPRDDPEVLEKCQEE
ncbi:hypothetical protein CDD83_3288 [Cordyceps sp. RAO-2017]|nr:hypothetical protein CDD83_3288 [Cordyceps sp. RAO-2017]